MELINKVPFKPLKFLPLLGRKLITKIDELISFVNEKKENTFSTPVVNDKLSVGEIDDVILLLEANYLPSNIII